MTIAPARPRAAFTMEPGASVFSAAQIDRLGQLLHLGADEADVDVLITGWGSPFIDQPDLDRMPNLRAVFHSAGTVKPHLSSAVWERGILVTSAVRANSLPVAEFTLALILLAGKDVLSISRRYTAGELDDVNGNDVNGNGVTENGFGAIGNYGRTVGIVGASQIGRRVIELLRPFDVTVLLYDPFVRPGDPVLQDAQQVPLDVLFRQSSIVSLHAPHIAETSGMISAELLGLLPDGATLINTARAGLVDQDALIRHLESGRINGMLDVTDPEPLPPAHVLRRLPNVLLTPHLAGARGNELHRLGASVVQEVEAFVAGRSPRYPVTLASLVTSA